MAKDVFTTCYNNWIHEGIKAHSTLEVVVDVPGVDICEGLVHSAGTRTSPNYRNAKKIVNVPDLTSNDHSVQLQTLRRCRRMSHKEVTEFISFTTLVKKELELKIVVREHNSFFVTRA